jgi:enamine deaminase RidA (YjgF/YER057c/UK114 family)
MPGWHLGGCHPGQHGWCYNPFKTSVFTRRILVVIFVLLVAFDASAQGRRKKKKKEDEEPITQSLPLLKDPPAAIAAETGRLSFRVSPLSPRGLLSQQVRDGLKALSQNDRGATIMKLRAFVAGTGDLRRVQQIVSEVFTDRKLPLPALSTIQVGGLPMEGAQVVLESIAAEKRVVNPAGLAFFAGQQAKDVQQAVSQLTMAVNAVGVKPASVLRATCFLSSLENVQTARTALSGAFPGAATNYVQLVRLGVEPLAECEAVGRLDAPPSAPVVLTNPPGLAANPNFSQVALVNAAKVVFSGIQMVFRDQDSDVRLAFERLQKTLEPLDVGYGNVFWTSVYPVTRPIADKVRAIRFDFLDHSRPPASTFLTFEGLPSLDATAAFEVIAAASQ